MVLLICPACTVPVVISPLSFIYFVSVCLCCLFTGIASAFVFAYFSAIMRAGMPFFLGTTITRLIATSCLSLESCYNLRCLSPIALHTFYILIGLQHPSEKTFPPIHISKSLLKNSLCGPETSIDGPGPSSEYSGWTNHVDALGMIKLSIMDPLALPRDLSNVVANNISKLSMINASGGGVPSQISLFCALGEQILVPY